VRGTSGITALEAWGGSVETLRRSFAGGQPAEGAAMEFEALLLGELLRAAHGEDEGWFGTGEGGDAACQSLSGFAEQQVARLLAESGGLGLAKLIAQGLDQKSATPPASTQSSSDGNTPR